MKKYITILYLSFITCIIADDRPKIALVLSGGGAMGFAQIPTLQIIDSLNIPIDYIVGTSMGAISGAMYAIGYSSDEILYETFKTNWDEAISNHKKREDLFFFQKNDYDKYPIEFKFLDNTLYTPMALTNGQATYMSLNKKIGIYELINNFDDFPIPFRCNAVDLLSGQEIIFKNGSLSKALRASTSIPSVFYPVKDNNFLLIDGGVSNNFPSDIAKNLGADIIIGVNVSLLQKESSDINTIFDVLSQSILINGFQKRLENISYTDILIEPRDLDYALLSFDKNTLDHIYKIGQKAAYQKIDKLIELKNTLNIQSQSIILPSIKNNFFTINDIIIKSKDDINKQEFFSNSLFPLTITKELFLNQLSEIRESNKYINFNYELNQYKGMYQLTLSLEKAPMITIENIFIEGNNKLSKSFIKEILDIKKGQILNFDVLSNNINKAYNLDLFENIRYEIENENEKNKVNIKFIVRENTNNKMKLSIKWHDYYKIIGDIKFDLINKPLNKFRITNQIKVGNTIKENNMNIYYIENFNYQSKLIPVIKLNNIKKEINLYTYGDDFYDDNSIIKQSIYIRDYSFNAIINLKQYGYIDFGVHKQKTHYESYFDSEDLSYYSLNFDIDQIDNILYPKKGYNYKYSFEKSNNNYKYYLGQLEFNHYFPISNIFRIKYYGDIIHSNLNHSDGKLVSKSIHYIPYDRTLSYSQFNLFVNKLLSQGIEINIDYKNSTTFRFLYNHIYESEFKHNGDIKNDLTSYGIGLRIKSILGPLNFMWTRTNNPIYNSNKNNYFFNIGFNY